MTETYPFFELKDVGEDGSFTGIASVYGVEDLGGDVIEKGAFKKTISENPVVPILWQHKSDEVIGQGTVKEWQGKIMLQGQLDLEDPTAAKAYRKMKNRLIKGLSIGYTTVKSVFEDAEGRVIRHINELKLWEVSFVTFPMLPDAQVTRVKAIEDAFTQRVKELEDKVSALTAVKSTPVEEPEPVKAAEPPKPSVEPDFHSLLSTFDKFTLQESNHGH